MIKERESGKVVILTKEVLVLNEEEVILILEVVFVVIVSNVVKKGIDHLSVDPLKNGQGNRNVVVQGDTNGSPSGPKARENLMVRRIVCNKGNDEEPILRRILFKTRCKMARKCCKVIIDSGSIKNLASKESVTNL